MERSWDEIGPKEPIRGWRGRSPRRPRCTMCTGTMTTRQAILRKSIKVAVSLSFLGFPYTKDQFLQYPDQPSQVWGRVSGRPSDCKRPSACDQRWTLRSGCHATCVTWQGAGKLRDKWSESSPSQEYRIRLRAERPGGGVREVVLLGSVERLGPRVGEVEVRL